MTNAMNNDSISVLVVEDNVSDVDLLRESLAEVDSSQIKLTHAHSLWEALVRLDKDRFDAVLLDLSLPDSQGMETFFRLHGRLRDSAVVLLAGLSDEETAIRMVKTGAQDYVVKEKIDGPLLVRSIHNAIKRQKMRLQLEQQAGELQAGEGRLRTIIDLSVDAIVVTDKMGVVRFANSAAENLFGRSSEQLIGAPLGLPITAGGSSEIEVLRRSIETPVTEMQVVETEWEGEAAFLTTLRDISDRKQLEEQLLQSQKMETVGMLIGGVAHDFNNLLTTVTGYATFVKEVLPPESPSSRDIAQVLSAAERGARLIRQLLAFSSGRSDRLQVLNLGVLAADVNRMLRRLIGEDIELVTLSAPDLGLVEVCTGQIEQVIVNLVLNARDAMPHGGKLIMETANTTLEEGYTCGILESVPGQYVMLSITDTGVGMTEQVRERIFEPFFTTKEVSKGTGLGLPTVYRIIEQHQGNIEVDSRPGYGSTFRVYLPRTEKEARSPYYRDEPDDTPRGHETILVVEDDPLVRDIAKRLLTDSGYTVLEAANGDEALRRAREYEGEIHLLLTDIVMPQMGGRELAGRLGALNPHLKIIFMSGYLETDALRQDVVDTFQGEAAFVQKPFVAARLTRTVREVLDKPQRAS